MHKNFSFYVLKQKYLMVFFRYNEKKTKYLLFFLGGGLILIYGIFLNLLNSILQNTKGRKKLVPRVWFDLHTRNPPYDSNYPHYARYVNINIQRKFVSYKNERISKSRLTWSVLHFPLKSLYFIDIVSGWP